METFTQRVTAIRDDHEHGSRWLARQALSLMRELAIQSGLSPAEQLQQLHQIGRELTQARPAMAAIAGAVVRVLTAPGGVAGMAQMADALLLKLDQAIENITNDIRPYLHGTIMTHSFSGTVTGVLKACLPQIDQLIILEGRPLYEGRAAAEAFRQYGVSLTLITDAQADIFLPMCQSVVVGADSVLADGNVLNKAGTALIARSAQAHGVPFYVLAETLKISPHSWTNDISLLEEQSGREIWEQAPQGVSVRNFYFDRTPPELITRLFTEDGPFSVEEIRRSASQLQQLAE